MDNKKNLEKQIKAISKVIDSGDSVLFKYDGVEVARYDFVEWSIDSKTPLDWLRGCLCFEISLKGKDVNKATIEFIKKC